MNNLTEAEKKEAEEYIEFPEKNSINFGERKIINHAVFKSRLRKAVIELGSVALEVANILCFGDPKDGHNKPIESTKLLSLTRGLMKGGE